MKYQIITPLGKREGLGTFDTIALNNMPMDEAIKTGNAVAIDFVRSEDGIIHFQIYHVQHPEDKHYHRLGVQDFPFGVDYFDDMDALRIAEYLLKKYSSPISNGRDV